MARTVTPPEPAPEAPTKTRKPKESRYHSFSFGVKIHKEAAATAFPSLHEILVEAAKAHGLVVTEKLGRTSQGEFNGRNIYVIDTPTSATVSGPTVPREVLSPARAQIAALLESGVSGEEILRRLRQG